MHLRPASAVVVALLAVALVGCTATREPPPGPDPVEFAQERIDKAWSNTGLEGTVARPAVALSDDRSFGALADCIGSTGLDSWMMSDGTEGPTLDPGEGRNTTETQLAMYTCFAQHPAETMPGTVHLTREQRDYLYDYYRSWVIPCLALQSITVTRVPTREEFLTPDWEQWNPYASTMSIRSEKDFSEATGACGSPYADLDIPGNASIGSVNAIVGVGG